MGIVDSSYGDTLLFPVKPTSFAVIPEDEVGLMASFGSFQQSSPINRQISYKVQETTPRRDSTYARDHSEIGLMMNQTRCQYIDDRSFLFTPTKKSSSDNEFKHAHDVGTYKDGSIDFHDAMDE